MLTEDKNIKIPTTSEQFKIFKTEANKWLIFFGLSDWQVHFAHKDDGRRAYMFCNHEAKVATIGLCVEWDEFVENALSEYNIKRAAFHEVCELMLAKVTHIASCRFGYDSQDLDEETHCIIRRLENSVFENIE